MALDSRSTLLLIAGAHAGSADYTRNNIGGVFAIVLDGEVISAPVIQSAITTGSGRITGNFSALEASQTALLIRSGALPAELTTLEQRSVGPQLGKDSVSAGTKALSYRVHCCRDLYGRFLWPLRYLCGSWRSSPM